MRKNLITILLVILIVAVIVAIGLLIKINNNIEKNSYVRDSGVKNESSLSDDNINNEVEKTNVENNDTLDKEEAKKLAGNSIKKYSNICGFEDRENIKGMPVILEKLGFTTGDELQRIFDSSEPVNDYYKTNVKYEVFKEAMLDMMTEEYFNNNFSGYTNMGGYVGVVSYGIGIEPVDFESVETIEYMGNDKYKCKAKMKDIGLLDYEDYKEELSDDELYFFWDVDLEKVNDKLLISDFVLDNRCIKPPKSDNKHIRQYSMIVD